VFDGKKGSIILKLIDGFVSEKNIHIQIIMMLLKYLLEMFET